MDIELDEADSIAEASAIMASVAAATTPVMPGYEHSRERDAGAETEVEQDAGGSRLAASLRRRPVPTFTTTDIVDLTEDVDQEMIDALPALPEDMDDLEGDSSSSGRGRDLSVSPDPAHNNRSTELLFEPDGEGSGSVEADAVVSGSDSSGHGMDGILNNKRKR